MSQALSSSTHRRYGLALVCRVWELARSSVYACRESVRRAATPKRRGRPPALADTTVLELIRKVLADSPFLGEGHRKVWVRLRHLGHRVAKRRVLRLMREAGLQAPSRPLRLRGPRVHDGSIVPTAANQMWGIDATGTWTLRDGLVTVFVAVDHASCECVGIHVAKPATRYEALEPIRQAVRDRFGEYAGGIAVGLRLRHDHGSVFLSEVFQRELAFLGIESSPAFVAQPEGNGCAERFIRTLKEQLLWLRHFETVEELRLALLDFAQRYNELWLIERHGYVSPAQHRRSQEALRAA
jgi:transposase InsO family protein